MMRIVASDEDQLTVITETFRLLGDPTRLKILLACLSEPKCVNDVASEVGITGSLTSHHLRLLRGARLVRAERQGRQIFYVAADSHVNAMLAEMVAHIRQPAEDEDDT
ncbi:ArsR/SmtB family transcription factor [Paramagnetospirillum magneticum]|uniref:ArsR/SmtB family transcription factor n=1 Tax=Paramagnetospirillum magneticum TaxID=84159 RepID=UPI00032301FE|nr:metalloregulator ArsR/SmtB family transcription factor [Paramagnetospirillum magneticum]